MIHFPGKLRAGIVSDINNDFEKCIIKIYTSETNKRSREAYQKHSYNAAVRPMFPNYASVSSDHGLTKYCIKQNKFS